MRLEMSDWRFAGDQRRRKGFLFNDLSGGPPEYTLASETNCGKQYSTRDFDYDSVFMPPTRDNGSSSRFDGLQGLRTNSAAATSLKSDYDVFASNLPPSSSESKSMNEDNDFEVLLGNLQRNVKAGEVKNESGRVKSRASTRGFDDLLPGFGNTRISASNRLMPESSRVSVSIGSSKHGAIPFKVLESSSVPGSSLSRMLVHMLDNRSKLVKSSSAISETSSGNGGVFDDLDRLNSFRKHEQSSSPLRDNGWMNVGPSRTATPPSATSREDKENNFSRYSETNIKKKIPVDGFQGAYSFHVPSVGAHNAKYFGQTAYPLYEETNSQLDMWPKSGQGQPSDHVWLTVSDFPLHTQVTTAPPPSRTPPPMPHQPLKSITGSISSSTKNKAGEFSSTSANSQYFRSSKLAQFAVKKPMISQLEELGDFFVVRFTNIVDGSVDLHVCERRHATMKDAMDKADAKFRHAKELREQEHAKVAQNKVVMQPGKHKCNELERKFKKPQESLDCEKKQYEVEGREMRLFEKEMERLSEIKRGKARQAVERETGEVHERTSAEACLKTEMAAVEKFNADARERAERTALQRAQIAAEAKEREEKAVAEAKEWTASEEMEKEARDKTAAMRAEAEYGRQVERAAVQRDASESKERDPTEARKIAAAAVKLNQQNGDTDLESFYSMGRASIPPRAEDPFSDQKFQNKAGFGAAKSSSIGATFNLKKASSSTNTVDNLSSGFGAGPSSGEFQEVEEETEERRRARVDRHQHTKERAAKALAEKNQRGFLAQWEQEERHRIADILDIEIKRWAAGKEGNLHALLSTMHHVLWPECGWQPVSLTDLVMGASVKKMYRKAALCIHPDKVQQKGATLEQKYIAEKVFDLLKEAWNKFNSEEHF